MPLRKGIYEKLINFLVKEDLLGLDPARFLAGVEKIDPEESPSVLARYLEKQIRHAFLCLPGDSSVKRIQMTNRILEYLGEETKISDFLSARLPENPEILLSILDGGEYGGGSPVRPLSGLTESTLFTGSVCEPQMDSELRKEIATSDGIDLLISFIRWTGLRLLLSDLSRAASRGARIRVITTSYMGATELSCLDRLSALPGAEIRISVDEKRTRLHAKAYHFLRNTGFSTAYVGSSNLSRSAITSGLEWNLKVTEENSPEIIGKFRGTFETYWNDPEFVRFLPEEREKVRAALARGRSSRTKDPLQFFPSAEIHPYVFQQEILDRLEVARELGGSFRNLVVAATGTGKTFVAAFDFRRFRDRHPRARFLFVAHRREILEQSVALFRLVLADRNFGTLWSGGDPPEDMRHLFLSVSTFRSRELWKRMPPESFEFIVADEVHHGEAPSWRRLLEHFRPEVLLGLTATPERHDGQDILRYFDGRIATEIRLPEAIDRKLLSPFQYIGVTDDSVDYRSLRWERGGYRREDLEKILTGNDLRVRKVLEALGTWIPDLSEVRGLGFCAGVAHADMMARQFNAAGISAESVSGETEGKVRETVRERLREGKLRFVFAADLYNEGVDLPWVNTILFLRPTESLTVFLQQLGRGLRLHEGKECLTVLDFIGHPHRNFSFESRFRALMERTRRPIRKEVEEGFPYLPSGCSIVLERVAQEYVLENVSRAIGNRREGLAERARAFAVETGKTLTLSNFLLEYDLSLSSVYRKKEKKNEGWSRLLVEAGVRAPFADPRESALTRGIARLSHVKNGRYADFIRRLISEKWDPSEIEDSESRPFRLMFHYSLWGRPVSVEGFISLSGSVREFLRHPEMVLELGEVLEYGRKSAPCVARPVALPYPCALDLHGDYTRDEILAGFGLATEDRMPEFREGVRYVESLRTDLLFVTLNKSEKQYSPSTMYNDYAISDRLFHWESQSTTPENSPTGRRYIRHEQTGNTILLFVRPRKKDGGTPFSMNSAYTFLGPVHYVSHEGSAPMRIVFRLDHALPAYLTREVGKLAVGT